MVNMLTANDELRCQLMCCASVSATDYPSILVIQFM